MAENNNDRLVIAYYVNSAAAKAAAEDLKDWDKDNDDVKLGAIGIITVNPGNGEVEVDEIGARHTKRGAAWGTAIGAGLGILTAGIALIPGMLVGAAVGGGLGHFNHKSLGMTDADVAKLADHLKLGGAALGVMCDDFEVAATTAKMVQEGGTTEYYELVDDAVDAVADAVKEVQEEEVAEVEIITLAALLDAEEDPGPSLLELGATAHGRAELGDATGLDEHTIMAAVEKQNLMRIDGVGIVYADLLHASGVASVPDLARRNPANLTVKMTAVNASEEITEDMPGEEQVADWVKQAGELPAAVEHL